MSWISSARSRPTARATCRTSCRSRCRAGCRSSDRWRGRGDRWRRRDGALRGEGVFSGAPVLAPLTPSENDPPPSRDHARSSRRRYLRFVEDYRHRRLDDVGEAAPGGEGAAADGAEPPRPRGKRREYMRAYLRWLRPHRYAIGAVFLLALLIAG